MHKFKKFLEMKLEKFIKIDRLINLKYSKIYFKNDYLKINKY
jgi:hypothetical protein